MEWRQEGNVENLNASCSVQDLYKAVRREFYLIFISAMRL